MTMVQPARDDKKGRDFVTRVQLDTQLHNIQTRIIRLGILVETALAQALQAVQSGDQALCELVIATDTTIDDLRQEVDQLTFESLTLQQPLENGICGFFLRHSLSQQIWNEQEITPQGLPSCCCAWLLCGLRECNRSASRLPRWRLWIRAARRMWSSLVCLS